MIDDDRFSGSFTVPEFNEELVEKPDYETLIRTALLKNKKITSPWAVKALKISESQTKRILKKLEIEGFCVSKMVTKESNFHSCKVKLYMLKEEKHEKRKK